MQSCKIQVIRSEQAVHLLHIPRYLHPNLDCLKMMDSNAAEFKRYAAVHENPKGAGDGRPTALQIIKDNDLEGKLIGKVGMQRL